MKIALCRFEFTLDCSIIKKPDVAMFTIYDLQGDSDKLCLRSTVTGKAIADAGFTLILLP